MRVWEKICHLVRRIQFTTVKVESHVFEAWNQWLVSNFYHYYGDHVKRWRQFRVQAVDGSTAYLINKKEVVEYFGVTMPKIVGNNDKNLD